MGRKKLPCWLKTAMVFATISVFIFSVILRRSFYDGGLILGTIYAILIIGAHGFILGGIVGYALCKKVSFILKGGFLVLIALILIIGFRGISQEVSLREGGCEQTYRHHYISPFMSEYLRCEVIGGLGCDWPEEDTIHNKKVGLLKCLCGDSEENKDQIVDYYSQLRSRLLPTWPDLPISTDPVFICKSESIESLFLREE